MTDLCDVCCSHGRHQGGEPLVRHEGGQQRLGAGGGDGDRGQKVGGAPSDIHRGGQRGLGSVSRDRGVRVDKGWSVYWMGRGVFGSSWIVFCD